MLDTTTRSGAIVRIGIVIPVVVEVRLAIIEVEVRDIAVLRDGTSFKLLIFIKFYEDSLNILI